MFGKLKEKLKSWFSSSKEKVEETSEVVKTPISEEDTSKSSSSQKVKSQKPKVSGKSSGVIDKEKKLKELDREIKKVEKEIIKAKKEKIKEVPTEFNAGTLKQEPDIDKIKEEEIIEKAEKLIEKAKKESLEKPPLKYDPATRTYCPDLEKIKEEAEIIKEQVEKAEIEKKDIKDFEEKLREISKKECSEEVREEIKDIQEDFEKKTKESFFSKLKSKFSYKISEDGFNEIFDDLEMLLLENNVALEVVEDIRSKLAEKLIGREVNKNEIENEIKKELKKILNEILIEPDNPLDIIKEKKEKPFVILFFGINGVGKTTAIAKVAYFIKKAGLSVVLAAGDTFRAASIEQIAEHAKKLQIPLIKHDYNADPSAVGFDAIKYAKNHKIDVVLIDTAGRMHTKANLIEEMKKIERVTKPDLKVFVAESIAGNDAVEQAKTFNEAIEIDGSILSKADIDEKGGTIISVSYATSKPIFYLGTGQDYKDLELFNKQKFIEELVG